jgi:hypothetical protein
MKKILFVITLFSTFICAIPADDLADLLQDLAVQTACLGMYSVAETGVNIISRYADPPDWYTPPMMANRFAHMSGNMTRITTFYGVCFDYAQFAWDDILSYQKMYNDAGMKGTQWYIAIAHAGNPNTIILYDPVSSRENATIVSNGVYLTENSRHNVYAHDGASGHAWLWVQHNNGTWYWIDPTWTDNTGYVWWGIVENGREVQYYPDPAYCVASNYPRPGAANTGTRSSNSTYTENTRTGTPNYNLANSSNPFVLAGYNFSLGSPIGFTVGLGWLYTSWNMNYSAYTENIVGMEITAGYSFRLIDRFLRLPVGLGISMTEGGYGENLDDKELIIEAGLQLILRDFLYLSTTYRLTGFSKSGFTIGAGFIITIS